MRGGYVLGGHGANKQRDMSPVRGGNVLGGHGANEPDDMSPVRGGNVLGGHGANNMSPVRGGNVLRGHRAQFHLPGFVPCGTFLRGRILEPTRMSCGYISGCNWTTGESCVVTCVDGR